jgi:hypothetical protein
MDVSVVYSLPPEAPQVRLRLPGGSTVGDAIERSGLLDRFPDIDLSINPVGIFGRRCELTATLRTGDRVEIYRPLLADPKDSRRQRVAQGRSRPGSR